MAALIGFANPPQVGLPGAPRALDKVPLALIVRAREPAGPGGCRRAGEPPPCPPRAPQGPHRNWGSGNGPRAAPPGPPPPGNATARTAASRSLAAAPRISLA